MTLLHFLLDTVQNVVKAEYGAQRQSQDQLI